MRQRRARATTALARPSRVLGTGLLALIALPSAARAQRAAGVGEDAFVLPRGAFRVTLAPTFETADERFLADGSRERFGAPVSGVYDATRLGVLAAGEQALRGLTNSTTARLSLGEVRVVAAQRATIVPLGIELGLGTRLQVGVLVPFVRTIADVTGFTDGDASSTAGFNPALVRQAALDSNTALVRQLLTAAAARETAAGLPAQGCAGSTEPACAAVNETRGAAAQLAALYGTDTDDGLGALSGLTGAGAVPRLGTAEATAVDARIAALRSALGTDGGGITYARPAHASAPLSATELASFVGDGPTGLGLDAFRPVERSHFGDIEGALKLSIVDGIGALGDDPRAPLGLRLAVAGVVRAPTGQGEQPGNALDLGTGDGQTDVEVRGIVDLTIGRAFWISGAARLVRQLEDDQFVRVPASLAEGLLAPASSLRRVQRDLGDAMQLEVTPRWMPNRYLAIAAMYQLRRKSEDEYASVGDDPLPGSPDVGLLGTGTEFTEHRAGIGVTWSTLGAVRSGRRALPLDVSFLRLQTLRATGGTVPALATTQLRLRVWFGATRTGATRIGAAPTPAR
jgi:hypothetical protein